MNISVVIPTCNRLESLRRLLSGINSSTYPFLEVIIIDSGTEIPGQPELSSFRNLRINYLQSERSVTIQRNTGIRNAKGDWIFICDDDIEVPPDYIEKLVAHIKNHDEAGAVSGLVFQKEKGDWKASYPEQSFFSLVMKYVFGLGIWGGIGDIKTPLAAGIKQHYAKKGNHISKSGWPVITDVSGEYFITPVYGLGASLIRKDWLVQSPYDEVLDRHGIGDHYGVALGFPAPVHIVSDARVYHHQSEANRLGRRLQYFRRALALDYFLRTRPALRTAGVKRRWLAWSLLGNVLLFLVKNRSMFWTGIRTLVAVCFLKNPYYEAAKAGKRTIEPLW